MLSFEEFQASVSAGKNLLTFKEFQAQVLRVFNCHWMDCEFIEESYGFKADLFYPKYRNIQFVVKYVTDSENCNYRRWIVIKRYEKVCKDTSNSLAQALAVVAQQSEENIKEEIALFYHIQG